MSIMEMRACLPSDDDIFLADDAGKCRDHISSMASTQCLSLVGVIHRLTADAWDAAIIRELSSLTTFALFLIIEGTDLFIYVETMTNMYSKLYNRPSSLQGFTYWSQMTVKPSSAP